MKRPLLVALIGFAFFCSTAQAETFKIDPARSVISFKVRHLLGKVTGRFRQLSGVINLDREHPEQSSVNATIQVKSIDTGIAKRDEHLKSADFFQAEKFPEISFKSQSIKRTGKESGEITGELSMHGVTRRIVLHVSFLGFGKNSTDETSRWRVTTDPIKRGDYGLRWSSTVESTSMIGQEVTVTMEIEATSR